MSPWKSLDDLRAEAAEALKDIDRERARASLKRSRPKRIWQTLWGTPPTEFIIDPQTLLPRLRRKWE